MTVEQLQAENEALTQRLHEVEESLAAIHSGAVDALVVQDGPELRVFSLQTADRPYRILVENMQQGALTLQADGAISYCNGRLAELLAVPHENFIGARLADFVSTVERAAFERLLRAALQGAVQGECNFQKSNGDLVPTYVTIRSLPSNGPVTLCALVTDLTAAKFEEKRRRAAAELAQRMSELQKANAETHNSRRIALELMQDAVQAKEALQMSEERYRSLVSVITDVPWTADAAGAFVRPQAAWARYTGQSGEELRDFGWVNALHPDDRASIEETWKRACASRTIYEAHGRLWQAATRQYRHFVARAAPLFHSDGSVREWVGTYTDVHEQKMAERAVRESEAVLRTVTTEARVGLVMIDRERRYVFANHTYAEILGLPSTEIVGQRVPDVLASIYDQVGPRLDRAFAGERVSYELRLPLHPKTGHERFYEVVYEPRRDNPEHPCVVVVMVDVTERKRAELSLEQNQVRLQEALETAQSAARAKDQFLAAVSHELRTPLTPVLMTIMMLQEDKTLPEPVRSSLKMVARNVELEAQMVNDLVDLSRSVNRKLDLTKARCDLHKVLHQALDICTSGGNTKDLTIAVNLKARQHHLRADARRLQQVFWNLIQNAIKFTPEGGSITMKSYSQGRQICVEVADTGCGIDSPDLEKIFEPFEQGPGKSKESLHGLGLGLAIARRLVEAHDGTLTASSQGRNCGAVFTVTLGLAPAKSALKKTRLSRKLQGR